MVRSPRRRPRALPTVIIRPGAANAAASSVASAIFREPLAGRPYEVPVAPETRMAVGGVRTVIDGLIALHEADGARLGVDRAVSFPSLSTSIEEMIEALNRVCAGPARLHQLGPRSRDPGDRLILATPRRLHVRGRSRRPTLGLPRSDHPGRSRRPQRRRSRHYLTGSGLTPSRRGRSRPRLRQTAQPNASGRRCRGARRHRP
jgi:hypothetical protein